MTAQNSPWNRLGRTLGDRTLAPGSMERSCAASAKVLAIVSGGLENVRKMGDLLRVKQLSLGIEFETIQ